MVQPTELRLDSWKAIAQYLGRDLRTVARWEREKGLPVHRVPGGKRRSVFAYRSEIDGWLGRAGMGSAVGGEPQPGKAGGGGEDRSWRRVGLAIGGLLAVGTVVALVLLRLGYSGGGGRSLPRGPSRLPDGVVRWSMVTLINRQPRPTPAPFAQMVRLDPSEFAQFEASDLRNIEFFNADGGVLPSWRESGTSAFSSGAVYWVRLRDGMGAAEEEAIYLGFARPGRSLLDGKLTGEAAGLSARYGELDNGGRVFTRYADFAGPSLPLGWYQEEGPDGQAALRIRDGVLMAHSGLGGGVVALGSDWAVGENVAEVDLLGEFTDDAQVMALVCSSNPTRFRWTPDSAGFQNMSGLELERNLSGTPSVVVATSGAARVPAVLGVAGRQLFADYQPVARAPERICGGGYLAFAADSGVRGWVSFDWARLRAPPPLGVMPTALVGPVH